MKMQWWGMISKDDEDKYVYLVPYWLYRFKNRNKKIKNVKKWNC